MRLGLHPWSWAPRLDPTRILSVISALALAFVLLGNSGLMTWELGVDSLFTVQGFGVLGPRVQLSRLSWLGSHGRM